jgi:hypothetical protein
MSAYTVAAKSGLELSCMASTGGTAMSLPVGPAGARTEPLPVSMVRVVSSVDCFFRQGGTGVAASLDGKDDFLPAGQGWRIGIKPGNRLAFVSAAAGIVRLSPEIPPPI